MSRCVVVLGIALLGFTLSVAAHAAPPAFENPPFVSSEKGELAITMTAAESPITVAKKNVVSRVFNGLYVPQVFRLQQGDTLRVHQVNNLPDIPINFHTHGLVTTPLANGDNVFVTVDPSDVFDTVIPIPLTHQSGMYWYHPHVHPYVNQVLSHGMSSALIIGDILAPFPQLAGITERVMILKDLKVRKKQVVDNPDPTGKTIRTINGLYKPEITIAPGELQFWRIGNTGANIFYDLTLKGVTFHVLAIDGNLQNQITSTDELIIPPGTRYEVLVRGPAKRGKYKLVANKFNTGPTGDHYPKQRLATLKVTGNPVEEIALPTPMQFPPLVDLREEKVDKERTVVFNDTDDPNVFVIDNQVWNVDRIDQMVTLGDLEEWTVQNASQEFHVFHIHQGDFQVTEINGVPQPFTGYQDTVNLPIANGNTPGEVKFRLKFDPPIIVGKYVYHCHIVQHEDQGMMANVEVVDEVALQLKSQEPPDLIASALTPASDNFWCN